ncbi:DEKNAAC101958 [Brettanomyces naardenensis]|uniref:DEKNAAC101958 n=1 Tax=Brettanomyces naardenensis TaxID=13370 RepID=A0A448YJ79_BRENA|nr:DEKNAAC101958 [Brettanomyces naardenensis]
MLENQIREISRTASEAYDQVDDLKTRNGMLEEQVAHQKKVIQDLMIELDQEKNNAKKAIEEREILEIEMNTRAKGTLRDSQSSGNTTNNTSMGTMGTIGTTATAGTIATVGTMGTLGTIVSRSTPATSVSTSPNSTVDMKQTQQLDIEVQKLNVQLAHQKGVIDNQRQSISQLRERVSELQSQTDLDTRDYEDTLNKLKSSMLAIRANRKFLGSINGLAEENAREAYVPKPKDYGQKFSRYGGNTATDTGKTYVISKLTPF